MDVKVILAFVGFLADALTFGGSAALAYEALRKEGLFHRYERLAAGIALFSRPGPIKVEGVQAGPAIEPIKVAEGIGRKQSQAVARWGFALLLAGFFLQMALRSYEFYKILQEGFGGRREGV